MKEELGYLRETQEAAKKAGLDKCTKINRTGLEKYLKIIFPEVDDWIHDKITNIIIDEKKCLNRPDYRSEKLKMIIEYDGLPHYQKPDIILKDIKTTKIYQDNGYKVIRIPYFIQLTNEVVKSMFNVEVKQQLFKPGIPSVSIEEKCTPAFLCPMGIERMAIELLKYPEQCETNIKFLDSQNNEELTGVKILKEKINNIKSKT